jgi:crotonobetainyl-CoA hydratase
VPITAQEALAGCKAAQAVQPVIAAVAGSVVAAGWSCAWRADIILAADRGALPGSIRETMADAADQSWRIPIISSADGRWLGGDCRGLGGCPAARTDAGACLSQRAVTARHRWCCRAQIVREAEDTKFQDMMNRITRNQRDRRAALYRRPEGRCTGLHGKA